MLFRFRSAAALFISLGLMIALLTITERILSFNAGPQSVHAQADSSRSTTMASAADPGFGPALFAVTLPDDESLSKLPPTMSLHTPLDRARNLYIASGGPDDLQILRDVGLSAVLLDASTDGQRYYLVDGQLAQTGDLLSAGGRLLYEADDTLLVSISDEHEQSLVETLTNQGIQLSLVTADPLRFADADAIRSASFKRIETADPFITGLLTQLNTADLATIIGDLSGDAWSQSAIQPMSSTPVTPFRHGLMNRSVISSRPTNRWASTLSMSTGPTARTAVATLLLTSRACCTQSVSGLSAATSTATLSFPTATHRAQMTMPAAARPRC